MAPEDENTWPKPIASVSLPATGLLRLASILGPQGPIPVSRSAWYEGIKRGRFPKPIKLGPRTTAWRVDDIRQLIERGDLNHAPAAGSVMAPAGNRANHHRRARARPR